MMKRMWIAISILTFALMLSLSMACADTLILPEDTVEIGDDAFYGTSATTIILPEQSRPSATAPLVTATPFVPCMCRMRS